jgi:hypothetical protein
MKTLLVLFLLSITAVQARLGETVAECLARYGQPYGMDDKQTTFYFIKDGVIIHVTFDGGKCVKITYTSERDWTPKDEELLRTANDGGARWKNDSTLFDTLWASDSGLRFSRVTMSHTIVVTTQRHHDREQFEKRKIMNAEETAKARDKTKGL